MIKKSNKKYAKVCGCDEYGREAWLMVSQHKDTDKVEVLSSEEGEPVVYTKSQISELIKELKKYVKWLVQLCRGSLPGLLLRKNMTALENGNLQLLKTEDTRLCIIKTS